jgi:methylenetetrahydrofolate dehydrogenase (NADP+)/methenyltetrahydrofolate cyclohydrolase
MQLLDGKKVSEEIKNEIAAEVAKMKANGEKVPHLAAIIVGNDGASLTYVGSKVKACERVGFESTLIKIPSTTSETELLKKIKELNEDSNIDGFIVQLPLPPQIDTQEILMAVCPSKDVDGFHPENFGKMALDMSTFIPAPFAIRVFLFTSIIAGLLLSFGVIDCMIASTCLKASSSISTSFNAFPAPGIIPTRSFMLPIFLIC